MRSARSAIGAQTSTPPVAASVHPADRWLRLARAGWILLAVLAVIVLILAIPGYLARQPMGNVGSHLVYDPTPFMQMVNRLNLAGGFTSVLLSYGLAALLFKKRRDDSMALFMAYYLVIHGLLFGGAVEMLEPLWPQAAAVNSFILTPLVTFPLTMTLLAIFPDGCFVPSWTRWLLPFTLLLGPFTATQASTLQRSLSEPLSTLLVAGASAVWPGFILALIYVQIYRYRYVSTREQRQQTKWVLFGFLVMVGLFAAGNGPWNYALSLPSGTLMPWWLPAVESTWIMGVAVLPITLALSTLRYRLYDVDVLINRTLVYGALTGGVIALYVLVVGLFGVLFQLGGNKFTSLLATGLVAVLFQPLRARLQRAVNRMMYGERDDPATVFARLGELLEASASPQEILPGLVRTIAQTLKLPYAAIELGNEWDWVVVAAYGKPSDEIERFALVYQLEEVGSLVVSPRSEGEELTLADRRLLENIAQQAGAVVHAFLLTHELQRSRLRLVTAREEERRRLRRDLHDELGPQLASQALIIEAMEKRLHRDPDSTAQLLDELKKQSLHAVQDIRQIVYDLRPPALDQLGLVGAIREALAAHQRSGIAFHLQAKEKIPVLPAAVEVAVYRIIQEAVTNVIRHAEAKHCVVHIDHKEMDEEAEVRFVIQDDGIGLARNHHNGVGLNSMRERAEELGGDFKIIIPPEGGTRVTVRLPFVRDGA